MRKDSSSEVEILHSKVSVLLAENDAEDHIIRELLKDGLEVHYIRLIIENVREEKRNKRNFVYQLSMGIAVTIGGIILNILSYQQAVNNDSFSFYIFWGIIAVGISMIFRAFIIYRR